MGKRHNITYPKYFNPRPPRGGRHCEDVTPKRVSAISIHAPREGGDESICYNKFGRLFISIHAPREGGDRDFKNMDKRVVISIHAPREGGDWRN